MIRSLPFMKFEYICSDGREVALYVSELEAEGDRYIQEFEDDRVDGREDGNHCSNCLD